MIEQNPFVENLVALRKSVGYKEFLALVDKQKTAILSKFMRGGDQSGEDLQRLQIEMQAWIQVVELVDGTIKSWDNYVAATKKQEEEAQAEQADFMENQEQRDYIKMHMGGDAL